MGRNDQIIEACIIIGEKASVTATEEPLQLAETNEGDQSRRIRFLALPLLRLPCIAARDLGMPSSVFRIVVGVNRHS